MISKPNDQYILIKNIYSNAYMVVRHKNIAFLVGKKEYKCMHKAF